jgi:hypothetical protein
MAERMTYSFIVTKIRPYLLIVLQQFSYSDWRIGSGNILEAIPFFFYIDVTVEDPLQERSP